ncbi:MAG: sulfur oxidation c-type cytochrome SoxX [Polaromonas sp.]|nr:sulfur oxidation c-type cytochrome SoxX [Polaromonas sp.]MDP3604698.1 sulfur oxidation c-type cytochrome SoxX [Polaromonas sp.]
MTARAGASTLALALVMLLPAVSAAQPAAARQPFRIAGDAIPDSLTGVPGNAARGRAIVASRQTGLCLLCHAGPLPEERFQGNLAPDLAGTGSRWSEGQLRLRVVDARRLNPQTLMPPYYQTDGLERVGSAWRGQPVLEAQQIEDVVAFLRTLRD